MAFLPILFGILIIIALAEILFWLGRKEKVNVKNLFLHTCKRKAEALFESLIILVNLNNIRYILTRVETYEWFRENYSLILKWIGYIGAGVIILAAIAGIFYVWIKLNERKYTK